MLKIFKNNNLYRVGLDDDTFDGISFDEMTSYTNGNELYLLKIMKNNNANVKYYNYTINEYVLEKDYIEHFINYDYEKNYILPECTFTNKNDAKNVKDILENYRNIED